MDNMGIDMTNHEFLGVYKYHGATVYRYRKTDTTPEEEREIIMGIKKVCTQCELRLMKEAEEKKKVEQERKSDKGY